MHRVSPSSCTLTHLHVYFKFIEIILETVGQSLHHSCRTELTRQGILLPWDRQGYGRRLLGLIKMQNILDSSCSTGQVSDFIPHISISQSLMFLINSRYPLLDHTIKLSFSRSYRDILPSSFSIIHSFALVYSTSLLVLGFVRLVLSFF